MKAKVISLLLVFVLLCSNIFVSATSVIDNTLLNATRLVDDEAFVNQEVYCFDDYALSIFYNFAIKSFDATSKIVYDVRDDSIVAVNSCGYGFAELSLKVINGTCHLLLDSAVVAQYFGLTVKRAELTIISKSKVSVDVTDDLSLLLSNKSFIGNDVCADISIPISAPRSEYYELVLRIETYLPSRSENSLSSGFYFIYPFGTTDNLAIDSNNASVYKVFLWNFVGSNTQVWNINVSVLNEYVTLKNVYSGLYLRWDLTNMNVILDTGGVVGNWFVIEDTDSYVTIKPWFYTEKIVRYDTLSNYSNVYLTSTPTNLIDAEKWSFIPVSQLGAAGSYRNCTLTSYRCYPYALRQTYDWYITGFSGSWTVNDVANFVANDSRLAYYHISCRILESGLDYVSYVKTTEYRIAVRIGVHPDYPVGYKYDYHFMEQLSDCTWAHKPSWLPSRNDITDPETDSWNIYNVDGSVKYQDYYNSDIVYIAVTLN